MKVGVMPAQVRLGAQPSSVLTNLPSPSPSLSRPQLFLPLAALLVAGAPTAISAGDSGECSPPSVATLRRFIGANGVGDNFTAIAGKACNTTTTIGAVCDYEGVEPDGKLSGAKLRCECSTPSIMKAAGPSSSPPRAQPAGPSITRTGAGLSPPTPTGPWTALAAGTGSGTSAAEGRRGVRLVS